MKIAIQLATGYHAVSAEPIQIEGFNAAIHKSPSNTLACGWIWSISDPSTGLAFGRAKTRSEVVKLVTERVQRAGHEKAAAVIAGTPVAPPVDDLPVWTPPTLATIDGYVVISVSRNANSFGYRGILALAPDGTGYELAAQAYGTDEVPSRGDIIQLSESRFYAPLQRKLPSVKPAQAKKVIAEASKPDVEGVVSIIQRAAGLTDIETAAVRRALNRRTGQLKAKAPSAFGDADEQLAAAAWQGLQSNGFKVGLVSVFSFRGAARELYDKLSAKQWPGALDADRAKLEALGVW